jgi:predicted DNA-binding ribbon-helix-helix protein
MYQALMQIERVQTGIRIERRLLKVLKGLAEHLDMPMGELIEGIVLHAFEGEPPFSEATRSKIQGLKAVYDLTLTAADSHRLTEARSPGNADHG